jgi:opacity protein-like surface antigen
MNRSSKLLIAATSMASLLALAGVSRAAEVFFDTVSTEKAVRTHGAYFGAFGGFGLGSAEVDFGNDLDDASLDESQAAFGGIEFGYTFSTPLPIRPSIELEFLYLDDDIQATLEDIPEANKANLSPSKLAKLPRTGSANLKLFNTSLNLILALDLSMYREDIGDFLAALHPYIGAGIGGAYAKLDSFGFRNEAGEEIGDQGDQSGFEVTYQLFGGLEVSFSDAFSVYAEYKYLAVTSLGEQISNYERPLLNFGFKVQY